jgi:hypothetical protein
MLRTHLRLPDLPSSWLADAAEVPLVKANTEILALIAGHARTPVELRVKLLRSLPLVAVMGIFDQPEVDADTSFTCRVHLSNTWKAASPAGRRQFASVAARPLWDLIWRTADEPALAAFLDNPRVTAGRLANLIRPPLTCAQAELLRVSRFRGSQQVIFAVLTAMARSLQEPDTDLVLGLAAPWVMALTPQERLLLAPELSYQPLERMAERWGSPLTPPA